MFTQCPDCGLAFRVTAEVLKQAAGRVRCGGCANAFNALAYLSEARPESKTASQPGTGVPELSPDPPDAAAADAPPAAISPEQSAALLKTLDQLAGSDVRLEDTGIEWRVMSDAEGEPEQDVESTGLFADPATGIDAELSGDAGSARVDEVLDDAPTPVDEFLTSTPNEVESGEVFEDAAHSVDAAEVFDDSKSPVEEELRFDDNTGLPEDFDLDRLPPAATPPILAEPVAVPEPADTQVDLAFGEPDEWGELLGEVAETGARAEPPAAPETDRQNADAGQAVAAAPAAEVVTTDNEAAAAPTDRRVEDRKPDLAAELAAIAEPAAQAATPDADGPLDIDTQFDLQAEAMGIELSGAHETQFPDSTNELEFELAKAQDALDEVDEALEETSIDDDLLAAAFESEKAAASEPQGDEAPAELELELETLDEDVDVDALVDSAPADVKSELARELEAILDDDETSEADQDAVVEAEEIDDEVDVDALLVEAPGEDAEPPVVAAADATGDESDTAHDDSPSELALELAALEGDIDATLAEEAGSNAPVADDDADQSALALELEAIGEDDETATADAPADNAATESIDFAPMSEEEQTIKGMIDQDLLSLGADGDDQAQQSSADPASASGASADGADAGDGKPVSDFDDLMDLASASGSVETIILEGDSVRDALEERALEEAKAAGKEPPKTFVELAKETMRGKLPEVDNRPSVGKIAAAVSLSLVLAVQLVHHSREALATVPAINKAISPLYRALGMPITPEWDVTGWRFEVTKGSTNLSNLTAELGDETEAANGDPGVEAGSETSGPEVLTIYSRIGNESNEPLPYPLISVSLTDRFEETMGSKVLEPGDYLSANLDPRTLVAPGNSFNAVISIESPAAEATGFKLSVCYRESDGQLRCALAGFK